MFMLIPQLDPNICMNLPLSCFFKALVKSLSSALESSLFVYNDTQSSLIVRKKNIAFAIVLFPDACGPVNMQNLFKTISQFFTGPRFFIMIRAIQNSLPRPLCFFVNPTASIEILKSKTEYLMRRFAVRVQKLNALCVYSSIKNQEMQGKCEAVSSMKSTETKSVYEKGYH